MIGSAWATFAAYFTMMLISYFLGQKYYPIPYRIKKMMLILLMLGIFSFVIVRYFDYDIIYSNILFVFFVMMILLSEKQLILKLTKR